MLKAFFSGATLGPLLVSGLIGGAVSILPVSAIAHNAGYGKAEKQHRELQDRMFGREVVLWYEVGAARQVQTELAGRMETLLDASDEVRAANRKILAQERARADRAIGWAADSLKELDRVQSDWKGKLVPADVIRPFCVRAGQSECDPTPATGAGSGGDLELRGSEGDAGDLPAATLPGAGDAVASGAGGAADK